jgi:hypothetical protein
MQEYRPQSTKTVLGLNPGNGRIVGFPRSIMAGTQLVIYKY